MGLSGASRQDTKVTITENQYHNIHLQALNKDPALVATLDIARTFGLRGEETVQSCQSLKHVRKHSITVQPSSRLCLVLKSVDHEKYILSIHKKALTVINNALHITAQHNGKLINESILNKP